MMNIDSIRKNKLSIIGGVFLVMLVFVFFYYTSGSASIISSDQDKVMFPELSCTIPSDCNDKIMDMGFSQQEIQEQLEEADFICEDNKCGVVRK